MDISDLEAAAVKLTPEQAERLAAMRRDYDKVAQIAPKLGEERAAEAWRRFLATYASDIPGSDDDDALRSKASANLATTPPPAEAPAVPPSGDGREQIEAYRATKRIDLSAVTTEEKIAAWQQFLAANGDDVPGTTVDDEQRRRAASRIQHWRGTKP